MEENSADREKGAECTKACMMYLTMSMAKINIFISLIGLILMVIDDDSLEMVIPLQGMIVV